MQQTRQFSWVLLFLLSQYVHAGDVAAGQEKSASCAACHGVDGNSTNPIWPKLAGQHASYLSKQLIDFRSGVRQNVNMNTLVAALSDEDIGDMAAYYSSQTAQIGRAGDHLFNLGERIFRAGDQSKDLPACTGCHSPNGTGNPMASFPSLSGQHAEYTKLQLHAYRDNKRRNKVMQLIAHKLTPEEIDALANYIQGLH